MIKQWLIFLVKLAIAGALIAWLVDSGRLDFSPLLADAPTPLHALGIAVVFASVLPQSLRWRLLLTLQDVTFSDKRMIQWTLIGEFFALALPGGAGTEMARIYYLFRSAPNTKIAALSSVILDRILALCSLMFLGVISFLVLMLRPEPPAPLVIVMGALMTLALLGAVAGFLVVGLRPSRRLLLRLTPAKYRDILDATIVAYTDRKGGLLKCFFLSLAAHVLILSAFILAGIILDSPLGWAQMFLVAPLVLISNILPISPAGIGVGETTASFLFALFGVANGAAVMLIVRLWLVVMQFAGGMTYLLYRHHPPE